MNNPPEASTIVGIPRLWPKSLSLSKPVFNYKVCIKSFIFKDKDSSKKLIEFLKKEFPKDIVNVKSITDGQILVEFITRYRSSFAKVNNYVIPSCNPTEYMGIYCTSTAYACHSNILNGRLSFPSDPAGGCYYASCNSCFGACCEIEAP